MEYMKDGGNTPTNPELWSRAKAAAKAKYDVYPSAYANGYAAKWYKERGGGWKKAEMGGTLCYECGGMYDFGGMYTVPFMEQGGMSMDFTKRFGGHFGQDMIDQVESYEDGGGIPERYKNMGFTKVGVKKESTSPGKKWMVLAKKGDQYKVVHGGYDGMKDYTQHGSEERRERFWDRMGGRDSAKAKDPFSPLYWHKRFGTWEEGGELPEMQDAGPVPSFGGDKPQFLRQAGPTIENLRKFMGTDRIAQYDLSANPEPGNMSQDQQSNSPIGSIMELLDITGIMSHDDARKAYNDWKASGNSVPTLDQALSIFSAVPALGKFGKIKYLDPTSIKELYKIFPWQQALNIWEMQSEVQDDYMRSKANGGTAPMYKYDDGGDYNNMLREGDHTIDTTYSRQLNNLENNKWNRGLAVTNSLTDPRSPIHMLPDKGFGSGLKALAGIASAGAGTILGYEKMFAKDKTERTLYNNETGEYGKREDVLKARWDKANPASSATTTPSTTTTSSTQDVKSAPPKSNMTPTGGSGMGAMEKQNYYNFDEPYPATYDDASAPVAPTTAPVTAPAVTNTNSAAQITPATPMTIPAGLQNVMNNVQVKRNGGNILPQYQWAGTNDGEQPEFKQWLIQNSMRPDVMAAYGDQAKLMEIWKSESGAGAPLKTPVGPVVDDKPQGPGTPAFQKDWSFSERGDAAGFVAANNALTGLGMANNVLGQKNQQKQYDKRMMEIGNTDAMYNAVNPSNPYGNYTTNVGIGPNFALVRQTAAQDFSDANLARYGGTMRKQYREGGSYMVSDRELMEILANGGDVEFL